jgi:type III pantothenate kinase
VAAAQAGALLRQWLQGHERYGVGPDIFVAGGGWPEVAAETQRLLRQVCQAGGLAAPTLCPLQHPVLDGLARMARDLIGQNALRRET